MEDSNLHGAPPTARRLPEDNHVHSKQLPHPSCNHSPGNRPHHGFLVLLRARSAGQGGHHPDGKCGGPVQLGNFQHGDLLPGHHPGTHHPPGHLLPQKSAEQQEGKESGIARHRALFTPFNTGTNGIPAIPPLRGQLRPATISNPNGCIPNCPSSRLSAQGSHLRSNSRHPSRCTRHAGGQFRLQKTSQP